MDSEKKSEFAEAAEPLMKWLEENCHPHAEAMVGCTHARLVENILMFKTEKYIEYCSGTKADVKV